MGGIDEVVEWWDKGSKTSDHPDHRPQCKVKIGNNHPEKEVRDSKYSHFEGTL